MARHSFEQSPIEEYLQQFDVKKIVPLAIAGAVILVAIIGILTCFYTVQPEEQAVVKRFGRVVAIKDPGLHFKIPFWIDKNYNVPVRRVLKQEFGFRTDQLNQRTDYEKVNDESLMLTGDLKVIDVEWVVQYIVDDPDKYLHRVRDRDKTIRDTSEAVMRRVVGNSLGSDVLTEKRVQVALQTKDEIQDILNDFDMGVIVETVELQDVNPPEPVKPAFNEVNQAEQERERLINEAERDRNRVIPAAEGQAEQTVKNAEAYAAERVNRSLGEAARFTAILKEYRNLPEVTRRRLYLEMLDRVLPQIGRIYVVEDGQMAPIPLLNLDDASGNSTRGGQR